MLRRVASHRIPPPVLDFLVPSLASHPRILARAPLSHDSHPSTSLRLYATSSTATVTPSTVSDWLDKNRHVFMSDAPASLTESQGEIFNEAFPALRAAFAQRDFTRVSQVWGLLRSRNLLPFFGPPQCGISSQAAAQCISSTPKADLSQQEREILAEITILCAAGGATEGLRELMLFMIKAREPQEALALYDQYVARIREKNVLTDTSPEAMEEPEEEDEEGTDNPQPAVLSPIRDDILLAAVIARMQVDRFPAIFSMYQAASTRIVTPTLEVILARFDEPTAKRIEDMVRKLVTASLLSRHEAFTKHVANLTRDFAHPALEKLYSNVVAGLRGPNPWVALRAADLSAERIIQLPESFWATFITSFLACRRVDLTERLWDNMVQTGMRPPVAAWNALMDGYAKMRSIDAALNIWDTMASQGVLPDALSYRAIIHGVCLVGKIEDGRARFKEFERVLARPGKRFDPEAVMAVYNTFLHHCFVASMESEAARILHKMETKGPAPDITTYNTFLRYYARKRDLKGMARILLKLEPRDVKANIYTCSTLLSAMLGVRPDADRMMIAFMKKQGVEPDTSSLTSVIDHQLREGTAHHLKVALDLLSKMERNQYPNADPNAITYAAVISGLNRNNWLGHRQAAEYNKQTWDRMLARGIQPNKVVYNTLIKASLDDPDPEGLENAMMYYRAMLRHRAYVSNDTWYILLRGLVNRGQMALASEVVNDLQRSKEGSLAGIPATLGGWVDRISRQAEAEDVMTNP